MSDNAKKSAGLILQQQLDEAESELNRSKRGLLLASFTAGLEVGVSLFLMAVMWTLEHAYFSEPVTTIILANLYSTGFILVLLGRSELFTEHTTMACFPVLEGRSSWKKLLRLWGLVWLGNMIGAAFFAIATATLGPQFSNISSEALIYIAHKVLDHSWWMILVSAIMAGWLMGLLSWVVTASRESISQIVIVWLVTFAIGLSGLHHSVVGSVEVIAGIFSTPDITWGDYWYFITAATLGNAIGGSVFVAFFKFQHAREQGWIANLRK